MATFSGSGFTGYYPEIQAELRPGESLLWSGQPLQSVIFHWQDIFTVPFSLLWGGFAIFWEWAATGHFGASSHSRGAPFFFALWGIPFVVMGQYLIWGRFVYTAWKKGRTYYAVTNKRVLVVYAGATRGVADAYLKNLSAISIATRLSGVGTIDFNPALGFLQNWGIPAGRGTASQFGVDLSSLAFFDIADARSVYQVIQSQRELAAKREV